MTTAAHLVLADGTTFTGTPIGAHVTSIGEAVFTTGMTGYQEVLTDPSYCGQIVVMTAPEMGNTGVNESDQEAPTGQIGTVYFADAPVFAYHNDPEKTKKAYNARGWSTLGDVGYLDEEGFLYLTDRKSYMIISGGVNIYPQETEDVLITHADVADVAVFGVPNEEMGEEVKAVVQPHDMARAGKELEAELMVFCRKHLSPIKCPKSIDFEAELPRTPTGKLVKRHLRDKYWPKASAKV